MSKPNTGLSLSFLDVLSCSLGGMLLLFLVFATLNHEGDRSSQAREGLPQKASLLRPAKEVGGDDRSLPILFEVIVDPLGQAPGTLAPLSKGPPTAAPWATASRDESYPSQRNVTRWLVFVPDPKASTAKSLLLTPESQRFRLEMRPITGRRPFKVAPAVILKKVNTAGKGKGRLIFRENDLRVKNQFREG